MREIGQLINTMIDERKGAIIFPASVTSRNDANHTIDVVDLDGNVIYDVRLKAAVEADKNGLVQFPALDSWVLVAQIGRNPDAFQVSAYTAVDLVRVMIGDTVLELGDVAAEIYADAVRIGGDGGEAMVLGESLNDNLTQLNNNLADLVTALNTFSATQTAAIAANPTLAALGPGYTALAGELATIAAGLSAWAGTLTNHLSTVSSTT